MAETKHQEAAREIAHWESVIERYQKRYKKSKGPLDLIMVEEAQKLYDHWTSVQEELDEAAANEAEGVTSEDRAAYYVEKEE